jgi:MYXO-CTERM domain-containing protein
MGPRVAGASLFGLLLIASGAVAHAAGPVVSKEISFFPNVVDRPFLPSDLSKETHEVVSGGDAQLVLWGSAWSADGSTVSGLPTAAPPLRYLVLKTDGIQVSPSPGTVGLGSGRAVFDGRRFVVFWTDDTGILQLTVIDVDGTAHPPKTLGIAARIEDAVFESGIYFIVAKTINLVGLRLDTELKVLGEGLFSLETLGFFDDAKVAAGDGTAMVVAHGPSRAVWAQRVSLSGQLLDPQPIQISFPRDTDDPAHFPQSPHTSQEHHVAFGAGYFFAAWNDERTINIGIGGVGSTEHIEGLWMMASSAPSSTWFALTPDDVRPSPLKDLYGLAFDGGSFVLTTFQQSFSTIAPGAMGPSPYAAITPGAVPFDLDPLSLSNAKLENPQKAVAAGTDGTNYLVAIDDRSRGLMVARVATGGIVLDRAGVRLAPPRNEGYVPQVSPSPGGYLLVWSDPALNSDAYQEYGWLGERIASSGMVLDGTAFQAGSTYHYGHQALGALDGVNMLVRGGSDYYSSSIVPVRDGVVGPPTAVADRISNIVCSRRTCLIKGAYLHVWTPTSDKVLDYLGQPVDPQASIATDGDGFALLFGSQALSDARFTLTLVNSDGSLRAQSAQFGSTMPNLYSNWVGAGVVFDGANYAVFWLNGNDPRREYHTMVNWVSPSGEVLLDKPFELPLPAGYVCGALAGGPAEQVLVLCNAPEDDTTSARAFLVSRDADRAPRAADGGIDAAVDAEMNADAHVADGGTDVTEAAAGTEADVTLADTGTDAAVGSADAGAGGSGAGGSGAEGTTGGAQDVVANGGCAVGTSPTDQASGRYAMLLLALALASRRRKGAGDLSP